MKKVRTLFYLLLLTSCAGIKTARLQNGTDGIDIKYTGFTISYNSLAKTPNWVAWELTAKETEGDEPRASHFYADPDLAFAQADNDDYRNSGWDKGHMAPAGDMKWDPKAMRESFYLTNICPQNHNLNDGDWKDLEETCRDLAKEYGKIDIICGPILNDENPRTIGDNKVTVPDAFFKVILIKELGKYRGIGFIFENKAGHKPLTSYSMTIDEVEERTGIDLFYKLKDSTEKRVESTIDTAFWDNILAK